MPISFSFGSRPSFSTMRSSSSRLRLWAFRASSEAAIGSGMLLRPGHQALEHLASVGGPEIGLVAAVGVRHQPHHVSFFVPDSRDAPLGAVYILHVAKEHAALPFEGFERLVVRVVVPPL